ncbi:NAD(P)/FAD-dependent oxidoreductase [Paenibacillus pini]|uniref:FAD dependent oxidoreductase n=1 Tax=Paenibacillus pini JCM 16418 TaxID=1236976 RepID=W7Y9E0_9BACL|nr:FAD-dependent oxidoreductase [Paenibacillus pini]GAF07600.1 FAD dependent oxidoreductase [Paenibacillus pini JCM 16418]
MPDIDAVVIGGGIGGSCLAIQLARQGWKTLLIDRQHFPRHKACGEFLSPESRQMLHLLGVSDAIHSMNPSLINTGKLIFMHGGTLDTELTGEAWGISRLALDSLLHQAAKTAGAIIETGVAVHSVIAHESGYTIELRRGGASEWIESKTIYGAWGTRRPSGMGENIARPHRSKETYIGVKTHLRGVMMNSAVELYFVPGGYIGLSPVEQGVVNMAAMLRRDVIKGSGHSVTELLEAAASGNAKLAKRLSTASIITGTQVSVAPVAISKKPLAWQNMPLVGDASVIIPPLFGDGMSVAMRSAKLCADSANRYLRHEISMDEWKINYVHSVRREFSSLLRWGQLLHSLSSAPLIPHLFVAGGQLFPSMKRKLVRATRLKEIEQ